MFETTEQQDLLNKETDLIGVGISACCFYTL